MLRAGLILSTIWGGVGLLMPVATLVAATLFWKRRPLLHISMAEEIGELSDGVLAAVGSLVIYCEANERHRSLCALSEEPAIERLHAFIEQSGYAIVGDHEEEYLRGPGMPFIRVSPEDYYTIIRYRVKKIQ